MYKPAKRGILMYATKKSDALNSKKTAKPLTRMKRVDQNIPHIDRYGYCPDSDQITQIGRENGCGYQHNDKRDTRIHTAAWKDITCRLL